MRSVWEEGRAAKGQNNRSGDRPLQQTKPRCRASRRIVGTPRIGGKPGATRSEGGHHVSCPYKTKMKAKDGWPRKASPTKADYGVMARTRRGLPEPLTILRGAAMTTAPVGGN